MEDLIRKYALQNAVKFGGKANPGAIIGKVISEAGLEKKDIPTYAPIIQETVNVVNSMTKEEQEKELSKYTFKEVVKEKKELSLPSPGKKVVMRFEPSPSGALHLGHAYVLGLNHLLTKKYKGKFILRIGDTNPDNIYTEAYSLIENDANWLTSNNIWKVVIQSSRMQIYYDHAKKLIDKNHAYVCTCDVEEFRSFIQDKEVCPCRDLSLKEQHERWEKMFTTYKSGEAVVRVKTEIDHPNPALREFPIFRINTNSHVLTKKKYRVWPLMNFSVAIDDATLGVTHSIRAKEHMDNEKRQLYILNYLGYKHPVSLFVGRINFLGMQLSASEAKEAIKKKKYTGWDDIKLPFLPALRKRGYQPGALLKYAEEVGVTERDKKVEKDEFYKTLNSFNKEIVEPESNRYFFVADPKKITIKEGVDKTVKLRLHPGKPKKGNRTLNVSKTVYITDKLLKSKAYRLIGGYTFADKKLISEKHDASLNAQLIQWVSDKDKVKAVLKMPDGKAMKGLIEKNILKEKLGTVVQLVRVGFARIESKKGHVELWFAHK
jgi:glutamyl-tRNA synthetase